MRTLRVVFSWLLLLSGVIWSIWGGLGSVALVSIVSQGQDPEGLWRAPINLVIGVVSVVVAVRMRKTQRLRKTQQVESAG